MNTLSSILNWIGETIGANPDTMKTKTKTIIGAFNEVVADGAGAHNSIYRGKYLGASVTAEQYGVISDGTFADLYIGDYWTINGKNWRIAAFDYWFNKGVPACTTHHVVIVPDSYMYLAKMNDSATTTGAYVNSKMYTTNLASAITTINSAFGSSHILEHNVYLKNATTSGYESGGGFFDRKVDLMTEEMVYGTMEFKNITHGTYITAQYTHDYSLLPLFALDFGKISCGYAWWLRDVANGTNFADVAANGACDNSNASNEYGVRPVFAIKA